MYEHDFVAYPELTNAQLQEFGFMSPHPQITSDFEGVVEKVHDGDTVTILTLFRDFSFPVRLLDIDAPELSEGGDVAQQWLEGRLLGESVLCLVDPNNRVGKYGRLLVRIMHRGMNIAEEMMHLGLVSKFGEKNEGQPAPLSKTFNLRQWGLA